MSSIIWSVKGAKSSPFKSRSSQSSGKPLHGVSSLCSPNRPYTFNLLNKGSPLQHQDALCRPVALCRSPGAQQSISGRSMQ